MKIVKLDNRYFAFKRGFTHALKFKSWTLESARTEELLSETYKTSCYNKNGPYYGAFARPRDVKEPKPYWIYLRNESDISLILLKGVANG